MPATPTAPDRRVARIASSSRCRGEIASGVNPVSNLPRLLAVNPTTSQSSSTAIVTSARAADASRGVIGSPEMFPNDIDPDTSSASRVRAPVGSTAANAA